MSKVLVHKPTQSLILPYNQEIHDTIPRARKITHKGKELLQIYHGEKETLKLLEFGVDAPFPAQVYYQWPKIEGRFDPMPHQKEAVGFMSAYKKCHNLSEPRTGKTHSILMTFDYLKKTGQANKMIVYATLSTLETVWAQSIFDSYPWLNCVVVHSTSRKRRIELLSYDSDIYITNHDTVKVLEKEIAGRKDIDMVVWDESDNLCNGQSAMWKSFHKTIRDDSRLILASGTPTGEKPTDAFALAKLVNPSKVPKYFGQFRSMTMIQISPFKWIPRQDASKYVHEALQPAICFLKKDVLKNLPPVSHERIQCELSDEQKRMFRDMQKEMVAEYDGGKISAVNAADKLGKVLQILLGVYKVGDDEYQPIDFSPRIDVILSCIKSASKKVIIFVAYTGALRHYYREIKKHYSCEYVDGSTSKDERARIFGNFQNTKDPHVVLAHPRTTAHGLELAAADTIIYAGPLHSGKQYMQSAERNNSIKQDSPMMIYYIGGSKIEWKIYDNMLGKKEHQDSVLALYQDVMKGKVE